VSVRLLRQDDPEWGTFLETVVHDFHHLPGYVALEAGRMGGEPSALLVTIAGSVMLLPLIVRKLRDGLSDATSPYGYPGPLLAGTDDPAFIGTALTEAIPRLREEGWVSLFVRSHPLLNPSLAGCADSEVYEGDTVAIDLAIPEDQRWRDIRRQHRQKILHAMDDGGRAWFDDDWTHFRTFTTLYADTMRRVGASPDYFFDDAYYEGLRRALGDRLRLMIVECGGGIAAAVLFVETCGIVEYHLMGVDEQRMRHTPAALAIHEASNWAAGRGDRWLHLGGGVAAAEDSLLHFKAGFSPRRFPFHTVRVVIDEVEYDRLARAVDPSWAGGDRRGYFPAYRRQPARSAAAGDAGGVA
jgi:hypothetical protein